MIRGTTKKLYDLSTGDEVYRYLKSIVVFFKGTRKVLSTSLYNGGYHEDYEAVYNYDAKQGAGMPCEMLAPTYQEHMCLVSKRLGLNPEKVSGMGTAANMECVAIESLSHEELTVTAIVTGGIETNGGRVGDPASYYKPMPKQEKPGTINIILYLNCDVPAGTLTRALVTCTEAKTAAIQELLEGSKYSNGIATGSGTDTTMVVANSDSSLYLEGAGKHSKLGELIGKVVMKAVKRALSLQSDLNPETQHDVFRRFKRFGITPAQLWEHYAENKVATCLKPRFLDMAEQLAKEERLLTLTSLYIHLLDQGIWGLLSETEVQQSGQDILKLIAGYYEVEESKLERGDLESCLKAYEKLLMAIVEKRV